MAKEKSKLIKKVTIDTLATIINDGFNGQMEYMSKEFGGIKKDIGDIKKDIKDIKHTLDDTVKRTDKLEMRVDFVENVLAIKKD